MATARTRETVRRRFERLPRFARLRRQGRLRLVLEGRTVRLDVPTLELGQLVLHPTVESISERSAKLAHTVSATPKRAGVPLDATWPDVDVARERIAQADELVGRPPFERLDLSGELPRWPDEHQEQAERWFEVASSEENPARFSGRWKQKDGVKYKETQLSKGRGVPERLRVDEGAIADFQIDETRQERAWKASDEELRAKGPHGGSGGFVGDPAALYVADSRGRPLEQEATYRVVSADHLVPSHDPETFRPHPGYPRGVQERAYHRDKAEQQKVRSHAEQLEPALLINTSPDASNGPPIVADGQIVLGGNSRAMSLQLAYQKGKAEAYRDMLIREARDYGLTPRQVAAIERPVLVRHVKSDEPPPILVRRYNEAFTQALDPRAEQVARARLVDERVLEALGRGLDQKTGAGEARWPTLSAYLSDARAARPFVDALKAAGVIDERNLNAYLDQETGGLNTDGQLFAERLLIGHLVPDADLLGRVTLSRMNTVSRAVPHIVRARSHGHDAAKALEEALRADAYMRRHDLKTLGEFDRDQELALGLAAGNKPELSAAGRAMLELLIVRPGPVQFSAAMRAFAGDAERHPPGQADLLGAAPSTAELLSRRLEADEPAQRQLLAPNPPETDAPARIVDNAERDRVQIFYRQKPPTEVLRRLKESGFRWARKQRCWQRPRSPEALGLASELVDYRDDNPPADAPSKPVPAEHTFPARALPPICADWALAEAEAVQVPLELTGLFALAVVSAAVAGKARIEIRPGWVEPLNLFICISLPPGERKSTVVRHATEPLLEHEAALGEGAPASYCDDATPAALIRQMSQNGGRMAVISAEGGIFEQMLSSGRSGLDVYLKGHAGDVLRADRITRESLSIESPALTVAVTSQPHVLERLGTKVDLAGRGLLARFIWAAPAPQRGERAFAPEPMPDLIRHAYIRRIKALAALPASDRPVRLAADALPLLAALHERIEPRLAAGGDLEWMADWAAKLVGAACRIAGLIAIAEAGRLGVEVSSEQLERAIRLAEWALVEAQHVLGELMKLEEGR